MLLPEFPRHWLAVAGEDTDKPLPHNHELCEKLEGAITCWMTNGYRHWPMQPETPEPQSDDR